MGGNCKPITNVRQQNGSLKSIADKSTLLLPTLLWDAWQSLLSQTSSELTYCVVLLLEPFVVVLMRPLRKFTHCMTFIM